MPTGEISFVPSSVKTRLPSRYTVPTKLESLKSDFIVRSGGTSLLDYQNGFFSDETDGIEVLYAGLFIKWSNTEIEWIVK